MCVLSAVPTARTSRSSAEKGLVERLCLCEQLGGLGHQHKEEGRDRAALGSLQVKGVHLFENLLGERRILNLLQAGAVDVPNAGLRDIS